MQATARMASVVSSTLTACRRLIRDVGQETGSITIVNMKSITLLLVTFGLLSCSATDIDLLRYPGLIPPPTPTVEIELSGHVRKSGKYTVQRKLTQQLADLIALAGGFDPLPEYANDGITTVAWIERGLPKKHSQLIILDYKNKVIMSERTLDSGKSRNERYRWTDFQFAKGDDLFVTTSRRSLDLLGYRVRGVGPTGWPGMEKLRLFGLSKEETKEYEAQHPE